MGNLRFASKTSDRAAAIRRSPLAGAIVCPSDLRWPQDRMFANLDDWYVIQSDLSTVSQDLLASLEWGVRMLGIDFVVVLGNTAIRAEIELQMAPYGVKVVSGIIGPNEVVRFEPH